MLLFSYLILSKILLVNNNDILVFFYIIFCIGINLAYHDGIFFLANKIKVHIIGCKDTLAKAEIRKLPYQKQTCATLQPGLSIHAIFLRKELVNAYYWKTQVIVAMETQDNQLDFSCLVLKDFEKETFAFSFKQCREVVPREIKLDPIYKVSYVIDRSNTFYGIALRESGQFDLYWNMTLIDSINDVDCKKLGCLYYYSCCL